VFVANSASDPLEILESNKVDLILMDIPVNGELNGPDFTKKIEEP